MDLTSTKEGHLSAKLNRTERYTVKTAHTEDVVERFETYGVSQNISDEDLQISVTDINNTEDIIIPATNIARVVNILRKFADATDLQTQGVNTRSGQPKYNRSAVPERIYYGRIAGQLATQIEEFTIAEFGSSMVAFEEEQQISNQVSS